MASSPNAKGKKTVHILIVEDLAENRILLQNILRPFGGCDLAVNGQEAVEIFETELANGTPYNLVMLDIMMPIMDGQQALKKMRAIEKQYQVPTNKPAVIIMITAVDAQVEIDAAFANGCSDYLNKPFSKGKLMVKLSEHHLVAADWWKQ